ncbi:MAG: hypothetical protein ACRDQU_02115 [Pseudonocardiaceae bacterium]
MPAQSESVFALSNGHIGWWGNLDEGAPHGLPGSYLKLIRVLVDDEPFDIRYGELRKRRAPARPPGRRAAPPGRVILTGRQHE